MDNKYIVVKKTRKYWIVKNLNDNSEAWLLRKVFKNVKLNQILEL